MPHTSLGANQRGVMDLGGNEHALLASDLFSQMTISIYRFKVKTLYLYLWWVQMSTKGAKNLSRVVNLFATDIHSRNLL